MFIIGVSKLINVRFRIRMFFVKDCIGFEVKIIVIIVVFFIVYISRIRMYIVILGILNFSDFGGESKLLKVV